MTNSNTTTTTNQGSSAEGQQPLNENVSSNVTEAAPTAPPSTHAPTPTPPPPQSTGQVNAGGGDGGFLRSSGTPPVRTHLTPGQFNVGGGFATGVSSVTPPGPNKGSPGRGSPSPSRGTSTPRRGSPSGGRRTPSRGSKSPPSGRGSPSSLGRGSSAAAGNNSQIGGSSFTPVRVEISLGGGLAAEGSMAVGGQLGKRKAEVKAPEGMTPTCPVCNRSDFSSWKALFGHQRSHPERPYRGAFPPPGQQQGEASNAANVREARDVEEDNEGRGGIDLNMPPPDDDDDDVTDDNMDGGDGGGGAEA
ncbi:translation initiation factor IF-2-like [Pyrus x bretschneideri]|uniref:translation initiation factor IF-2-like n=1 Tax=Pyrus x bretschneideri TaxID=225117 RepID=UPI000511852E|nr:translation initiation factor IF-2-like [Pyrus x bretschneideri]